MKEYIAKHEDVGKQKALAKVLLREILAQRKDMEWTVEASDDVLMKIIPKFREGKFGHIRGIFEQALSTQRKRAMAERQQKDYEMECMGAYLDALHEK